ncbi:MAG: hypothetical protein ACREE7_12050, partial [Dongiaceae bacterium]
AGLADDDRTAADDQDPLDGWVAGHQIAEKKGGAGDSRGGRLTVPDRFTPLLYPRGAQKTRAPPPQPATKPRGAVRRMLGKLSR